MFEQPDLFWHLMKINQAFCVQWANAQLAAGATAICYFDPVSSTTITTRKMYLKTGFEVACQTLAQINGPTATHMASGRCLPILQDIADTGTAAVGVSCLEDIRAVKAACKNKLTVIGNLNGIEMRRWSGEQAESHVRDLIAKAGVGGGFILSAIQTRLSGFSRRYAWTDSGNGFQMMIRYNQTDLGVLEIDDVQFPDEKERYLSLSLSITEVCGLAIENAKRYQFIRDAEDQLRTEKEKLEKALSEVKTLSGLIPICSHCKKIRDDKGYWNQVEAYIQQHSDAKFSHGICQDCLQLHYAEYMPKKKE